MAIFFVLLFIVLGMSLYAYIASQNQPQHHEILTWLAVVLALAALILIVAWILSDHGLLGGH